MVRCSAATFCHGSNSKDNRKLSSTKSSEFGTGPYSCLSAAINQEKLETLVGTYEVRKKGEKTSLRGDKVSDAPPPGTLASTVFDIDGPLPLLPPLNPPQTKDRNFLDDKGPEENVMTGRCLCFSSEKGEDHERRWGSSSLQCQVYLPRSPPRSSLPSAADQGVLSPSTSSIRRPSESVAESRQQEAAVKDYRHQVT
ncbi:hypothetical protein GWK47_013123 [Chionoecetes opilio]|uniref:Uncharacterized protein n=1 Tax=Chionoecetes opilio TaxID=41210 RepID=A0A8J5C1I8_CHIOP|nr:hypothetical protein GWK47_013123 [Chionoecetes opilio]